MRCAIHACSEIALAFLRLRHLRLRYLRMGGRVSTLSRRIAPRLGGSSPPPAHPHSPPPSSDLSHLPPRAVSEDFAQWQQVQQKRLNQEKWHTQRMLEEQSKELQAQQAQQASQAKQPSQQTPLENVNQPIKLAEIYQDIEEYQVKETSEAQEPKNIRGGYADDMEDVEFQEALKKLSASMPLQPQVPESVEFSREMNVQRKQTNDIGLLHWENWVEVLQLHNYNPTKWTAEELAKHFKVDPVDLSHALKYTMLPHLSYSKKQVTAHWQTEISTYTPPAPSTDKKAPQK